jgi:hypothetical protein
MLRGFAGFAALGSAAAIAAWVTVGPFSLGLTAAVGAGESMTADDAVELASAFAEDAAPAAAAIPLAAIVDASLLSPYPMVAAARAAPVQVAAASAPEPAAKDVTGSIRPTSDPVEKHAAAASRATPAAISAAAISAAPTPAVRKPLIVPRLERDGTLDVAQIANIKTALNLSPDQERHWLPVEAELRDIARQLAAQKASGRKPTLALGANEAQRLYWAAGPLIMSLREDQKREVRRLARAMGLEQVASLI